MKRTVLGFVVASMVFSSSVFAQTPPPAAPPAGQQEWVALMKKQSEARKALNDQLNTEREAFLKSHPEVAAIIEAQMKAAKERAAQRKAMSK